MLFDRNSSRDDHLPEVSKVSTSHQCNWWLVTHIFKFILDQSVQPVGSKTGYMSCLSVFKNPVDENPIKYVMFEFSGGQGPDQNCVWLKTQNNRENSIVFQNSISNIFTPKTFNIAFDPWAHIHCYYHIWLFQHNIEQSKVRIKRIEKKRREVKGKRTWIIKVDFL